MEKQWGQVQFPETETKETGNNGKQWETMGSGSISSMEPEGPRDYEVIRKLNLPPFLCLFCAIRKLNLTPFLPFLFFLFCFAPFFGRII
jgi:hypothetical protein